MTSAKVGTRAERKAMRLRWKAANMVGGLFVMGLVAGYGTGRALSPVFDSSPGGQLAIRDAVGLVAEPSSRVDLVKWKGGDPTAEDWREYSITRDSSNRLLKVEVLPDYLAYTCGVTRLRYDLASRTFEKRAAKLIDYGGVRPPRRGLQFVDALTFAVGGLRAYQLPAVAPRYLKFATSSSAPRTIVRRVIAGTMSVLTGAGIGLYFGYRNDFNCGDDTVQSLLSSPEFWVAVNAVVRDRYTFVFLHRSPSEMVLDPEHGAGSYAEQYRGDMSEALVRAEFELKQKRSETP